jgi:hypothetical protein
MATQKHERKCVGDAEVERLFCDVTRQYICRVFVRNVGWIVAEGADSSRRYYDNPEHAITRWHELAAMYRS